MTPVERVVDFAERLARTELVENYPLRGCTEDEIAKLERRNSIKLPATYREFLKRMGHCAAGIGSEELLYYSVLTQTEYMHVCCKKFNEKRQAEIAELNFFQKISRFLVRLGLPEFPLHIPDEAGYSIPSDIFFIFWNDVETTYWAIKCDNSEDSPILTFNEEWELESAREFDSLVDFLDMLLAESLDWHLRSKEWREAGL